MNWWVLAALAGIVVLIVVAVKLGWIDLSDKTRRGSGSIGGSVGGAFDEIFAPTRHEAQQEMDRQSFLPAPAPLPGDGARGAWTGGKISIDLPPFSAEERAAAPFRAER